MAQLVPRAGSGLFRPPKFTVLRSRAPGPALTRGLREVKWAGRGWGPSMPWGFRPSRVPGSQAERVPAPAFWAGEERRRGAVSSVSAELPRRGPPADWPAPGRKLGLYLQLITPRPGRPHPVGAKGPLGGWHHPSFLEKTPVGKGLLKAPLGNFATWVQQLGLTFPPSPGLVPGKGTTSTSWGKRCHPSLARQVKSPTSPASISPTLYVLGEKSLKGRAYHLRGLG